MTDVKSKSPLHESMFRLTPEQLGRKTAQEILEQYPKDPAHESIFKVVCRITGATPSNELQSAISEIVERAAIKLISEGKEVGMKEQKEKPLNKQEQATAAANLLINEALPMILDAEKFLGQAAEILAPLKNKKLFGQVESPDEDVIIHDFPGEAKLAETEVANLRADIQWFLTGEPDEE